MIALGSAADGGLLAESRALRAFAARETAIASIRHARECVLYRHFVDGETAGWSSVLELLRDCARELGDGDHVVTARIVTARIVCDRVEAQRASVDAFAAVARLRVLAKGGR